MNSALSAGIRRWDLGIALCLFALGLLWLLEMRESEVTGRSMELSVRQQPRQNAGDLEERYFTG